MHNNVNKNNNDNDETVEDLDHVTPQHIRDGFSEVDEDVKPSKIDNSVARGT